MFANKYLLTLAAIFWSFSFGSVGVSAHQRLTQAMPPSNDEARKLGLKAHEDATEKSSASVSIRRLSSETAVLEKSLNTMQSAFQMKSVPLTKLRDEWQTIDKMKACVNRTDAALKAVYESRVGRHKEYLISIKGEISGTQVIIGHDCTNAVLFDPIGTVIMGYLSQSAQKHGRDTVLKTLLPISRENGQGAIHSGIPLNYQTAVGTVSITEPSTDKFNTLLKTSSGQVVYQAEYEAFSTK